MRKLVKGCHCFTCRHLSKATLDQFGFHAKTVICELEDTVSTEVGKVICCHCMKGIDNCDFYGRPLKEYGDTNMAN